MAAKRSSRTSSRTGRTVHTIRNAANSGDRRRLLVALRNRIADDLDSGRVQSRDLASLSKRLMDIAREIDAIDKADAANDQVSLALDVDDEIIDGDDADADG